jgi:Zn finger protein HypA/HybF involved in hydrogenase expression
MNPKCQRCGVDIPTPPLSSYAKKVISGVALRTGRLQAAVALKNSARIGLAEAKAIAFHLADEGGKCHRCGTPLMEPKTEQSCPKCQSLNLKW